MRILLVEDNYLQATRLQIALQSLGTDVLGPFACAEEAGPSAGVATAAILDLTLDGGDSLGLAEGLRNRDVPFLFYTAHPMAVPPRFSGVAVFAKPTGPRRLVQALVRQSARALAAGPDPDPVLLLPELRQTAMRMLGNAAAGDRLVEAVLRRALKEPGRAGGEPLRDRLHRMLREEYDTRGRFLLS